MSDEQLFCCPFCGCAQVEIATAYVSCGICGGEITGATTQQAITRWNRRASPSILPKLEHDNAVLRQALEELAKAYDLKHWSDQPAIDAAHKALNETSTVAVVPLADVTPLIAALDSAWNCRTELSDITDESRTGWAIKKAHEALATYHANHPKP